MKRTYSQIDLDERRMIERWRHADYPKCYNSRLLRIFADLQTSKPTVDPF